MRIGFPSSIRIRSTAKRKANGRAGKKRAIEKVKQENGRECLLSNGFQILFDGIYILNERSPSTYISDRTEISKRLNSQAILVRIYSYGFMYIIPNIMLVCIPNGSLSFSATF